MTVTVVERDVLADDAVNRRGVPQGRHVHALLGRGSQVLAELFPGFLDDLVAAGVPVLDYTDLSKVFLLLPAISLCVAEASETSRPPLSQADHCWSVLFGDGCAKRRTSRFWRAMTLLI